jgi:hypothetical protein
MRQIVSFAWIFPLFASFYGNYLENIGDKSPESQSLQGNRTKVAKPVENF